jgi:phenylacetate-CoA ligase
MRIPVTVSYLNPAVERMSRKELEDLQLHKLKRQMEYAYRTNPFYRKRFDEKRLKPADIVSLEAFAERVPFVTKDDFILDQEEHPPYGSRLGVPPDTISQVHLTSGTSGLGQEVYARTRVDVELMGAVWMHNFQWSGLTKGDTAVNMVPIGTFCAGWSIMQGFFKMGLTSFHLHGMDGVGKLRLMQRFKPHYIWATPPYLTRLTVLAKEQGIDPRVAFPTLKSITVATEAFPVSWAQEVEEIWGTRLHEMYGSTQGAGLVAVSCEKGAIRPNGERGSLHVAEQYFLAEVLDPATGRHVRAGEEGEVILTSLDQEASPVIRFRTRDRVRFLAHDHCECGRPFNIWESGTITRYDDMLKIRGMNVWPSTVDSVVFAHKEVDEYVGRVTIDQEGREQVLISVALKPEAAGLAPSDRTTLFKRIGEALKASTGVSMELHEVARAELPTFEFKSRRWSDQRQQGLKRGG